MSNPQFTREHHEKAFNVWCETHNWTKVQKEIGCAYDTPRRWAEPDFRCDEGCPWHGWDRLEREKKASLHAQAALIEQGNFDPAEHDKAIRRVMMGGGLKQEASRIEALQRTVRSDLERLAHWELIYSKMFFIITGQAIDWTNFNDPSTAMVGFDAEVIKKRQDVLRSGLSPTSCDQAVKLMRIAEERIFEIMGRPKTQAVDEEEKIKTLSLDDLRKIRANMKAEASGGAAQEAV